MGGWGLESLPDEFAILQSLEKLDLSVNDFYEFPKVICKLKNLKELVCCGICDVECYYYQRLKSLPDEFANLQRLERLNLKCNPFQEFPKAVCKLKNLKELNLKLCDLKSLPDEFANLQNLERLDLSENNFYELPKIVCKLKNLKELVCCGFCDVEYYYYQCLESLPDEFANLQKLEKLELSGNNFKEFPKVINKLKNLKECDIKEADFFNKIKEIDVDDFDDTELPF